MESGAPEAPSLRVFGGIQRRATREKRSGAPKATHLNASLLASKIKAKILNNSSLLKTSLKINNKALAVALSAEKENSRRLKNENLLLQREVDELHFQNVSLREKLICLNKTLIKIEAFLNNNLLTAIEMTIIPEHIAKSVTLEDQCNSSDHQIRSVEQHGDIPYIAKHEGKKQDEIVVCKALDHLKHIFVLSAEAAADQMSPGLSVAEGMQHSSETNKMETVLVTNIFAKENQSSVEQLSSNALNVGLENESSVGECEKHSKAGNSPFPICGYVTKRKKRDMVCKSITPNDSDRKTDLKITSDCSTDTVSTTNEICYEIAPKGASHIELCSQPRNEPGHTGKVSFSNDHTSEETVYDTDMELTASDLGEILIIKSKGKERNTNIIKGSKKSSGLREMKYSNAEKQIKDNYKTKRCNKNIQKHGKVKQTRTIENKENISPKKPLSKRKTFQGEKLKNTKCNNFGKDFRSSNKNDRQIQLVNLENHKQTTNILQTEKVTDTISETVQNVDNQVPERDISVSGSEDLLKTCCTESLPLTERDFSNVMVTKQHLCAATETSTSSKSNQGNHQTEQSGKTNAKSSDNSKEIFCNYNITTGDEGNEENGHKELSQSDKRRIFAKASRKTYIIYPKSHSRGKTFEKQELQDENIPPTDSHKAAENKQRTFNVQNVQVSCSQQETEFCAELFPSKVHYRSKSNRKTNVVSSCDQNTGRSIENAVSKSTEDTTGIYRVQKNIPVLKSPEILQRHYQGRKGCASIQKGDKVCEESHSQTSISDSGNKPLQELTNISIHCLPNPKKDLEEKATTPVRRRRTTVCYKEPSIKSKLRRGDELTDKSFLNSPVFKIKNKPTFKSKSRLL
ncbi:hypothetical protein JRQ81_001427 [Phrynocephalus forsythii]|uniref:Shugoshin C-terminal domain-containing protein n=1 Tax=Phrynocephalus forsythii TaxID=171643 RepID=A0A9Q0Y8B9_9SAUR|nr:hypothetical protein JRQ81_001427 [Phrynocephalus forsythii]